MSEIQKYNDRVYGSVEITEPIVLEIINTPEFQRLKDIDQGGYFEVHFPGSKHNRFEHSVGVYELLRRYGASLDEQIAGLLHDVSHSAFSHTIDYIVHDGSGKYQTYQDEILTEYVKNSSITQVLQKYNIDVDYITDDKYFPLKETELPDLCADRIDYALRAFLAFNIAPIQVTNYFLSNLKAIDNKWVFNDVESARRYANLFKELNDIYYSGPQTAHMFHTTAEYLRRAMDYEYITRNDLYTSDSYVLNKIKPYQKHDLILQKLFLRMDNIVHWDLDKEDYTAEIYCKSRCVDPLCRHAKKIMRLSDIHAEWRTITEETLKPKRHFIKFYD